MIYTNNDYNLLTDQYLKEKKQFPSTIYSKKSILNRFGRFISFRTNFNERDLVNYLKSEEFEKLQESTKDNHKLVLRNFFLNLGFNNLPTDLKSAYSNGHYYVKKKVEQSEKEKAFCLLRDKYVAEKLLNHSESTVNSKITAINAFGAFVNFKKSFSKDDLINYLNSERFVRLKTGTKNLYKIGLKGFFKYCGIDASDLLKKVRIRESVLEPTDLLTKDELRVLLRKLDKPIHKAIITLLLESKARKMEILNLKIKDLVFYDSHAIINVRKSKTTPRPIPIVESVPFLNRYLEDHPFVEFSKGKINCENYDAYLFGHFHAGKFVRYSKNFVNDFLNRLTKREKDFLSNKRLYPHLFRHTGLTNLAKANVNESIIRKVAGYTDDSNMIKRYVHLANDDVEKAILNLHGITKSEKENDSFKTIESIHCPRCDYENSDLDKFCSRCGSVLDQKIALEHQKIAAEIESDMSNSDIKKYIDELFEQKLKKFTKN